VPGTRADVFGVGIVPSALAVSVGTLAARASVLVRQPCPGAHVLNVGVSRVAANVLIVSIALLLCFLQAHKPIA
jgi:hypothetical protein